MNLDSSSDYLMTSPLIADFGIFINLRKFWDILEISSESLEETHLRLLLEISFVFCLILWSESMGKCKVGPHFFEQRQPN